MATLRELQAKYNLTGGNYEPKPGCKFCHGTGEKKRKDGKLTFCICLFVEPSLSDFAGDSLSALAKKELAKLAKAEGGGE